MLAPKNLLSLLQLSRRFRRRVLAAYWLLALSLIALMAVLLRRNNLMVALSPYWLSVPTIVLPQILRSIRSYLSKSIKATSILNPEQANSRDMEGVPPQDERERAVSHLMYMRAYVYLSLYAVPLVFSLTCLENPDLAGLLYLRVPMLWLLWILVTSLPQSLILWNEPDMEPES